MGWGQAEWPAPDRGKARNRGLRVASHKCHNPNQLRNNACASAVTSVSCAIILVYAPERYPVPLPGRGRVGHGTVRPRCVYGVYTVIIRCVSHVDRSPWDTHRIPSLYTPYTHRQPTGANRTIVEHCTTSREDGPTHGHTELPWKRRWEGCQNAQKARKRWLIPLLSHPVSFHPPGEPPGALYRFPILCPCAACSAVP